jgi:serine/threonine protein kinase
MYLEYCAYGNLAELCERYEQDLVNPLPERLLWNLFECLALVCLALKSASRTNNSMEVVHQNITPWNILLADKNGADWPGQPTFKLSGFGSAEETSSQDPGNPQQIRAPGTFGYVAPEQDADKGGHRILGEHTNIWACGNLMQKTMAQSGSHVAYSQALRSLVAECVRDQEKMRPTAKQLLNRIRAQVSHGSFERGFFSRIKNFLSKFWRHFIHEELATTPYKFQRAQPHENHHFLPDKYRLGTARDVDDEADISHLGTITVPDSDDDSDGNDQGSRICQVPLSDR